MISIFSLLVAIIIFKIKPYKGKILNIINCITEVLFIGILIILATVVITEKKDWFKDGWIVIMFVSIIIAIHLLLMLTDIYLLVKSWFVK